MRGISMGGEGKMEWVKAHKIAKEIVEYLMAYCDRIEIAGSVRRHKPEVGDIEIVIKPKMILNPQSVLFGEARLTDFTETGIKNAMDSGILAIHPKDKKMGEKYKKMWSPKGQVQVDLFIVRPPATWGVIFTLRTGPADFNKRIVTECRDHGIKVEDGQVWKYLDGQWKVLPTPEEKDFFLALGIPWQEPEDRR
jgi:DNA polymerase/3'-5' exonuclease PolX